MQQRETGNDRLGRRLPPLAALALVFAVALAACETGLPVTSQGTPKSTGAGAPADGSGSPGPSPTATGSVTPTPGASGVEGDIPVDTGGSGTPTPAPTKTPTPPPGGATATPPPAIAQTVTISWPGKPAAIVINVPAPAGATPLGASTIQLSAEIGLNDNQIDTRPAKWSSNNPAVATVDAGTGLASGKANGAATITATSADDQAAATVSVTVRAVGDISLEVK